MCFREGLGEMRANLKKDLRFGLAFKNQIEITEDALADRLPIYSGMPYKCFFK